MKKLIMVIVFFTLSFIITSSFLPNNDIKDKNSEFNHIKYFKSKNADRYKNYKSKFPNKKNEEIVKEVNIGLDKPFYRDSSPAKNLNTQYVLVNKYNFLSRDYTPSNLVEVDNTKLISYVAQKFNEMKNEAKRNNLNIVAISGYRSFDYQSTLYNKYVTVDGRKKADTYSARAGFSEHQTGLAVDVSNGKSPYYSFENTDEFKWMCNNAYKYGFILRYPKDKEYITGYIYESWHYRYVGVEAASFIKKNNITYDEYYVMFIDN